LSLLTRNCGASIDQIFRAEAVPFLERMATEEFLGSHSLLAGGLKFVDE
jgi:hypothetical protein